MADRGPSLGWSDDDLETLADPTDRDVVRAGEWNWRHMPPPFAKLNDAEAFDTDEAAQDAATEGE